MDTNNKYVIFWEKWKDPFGYDEDNKQSNILDNPPDYDDDPEPPAYAEQSYKKIKCKIIETPFGIMPFNENTASSEIFNFWTGHANFPVTLDIANIIDNIDGVETLNIFTKYRFRIAIGKAFIDSDIMRNINKSVYAYLENKYECE